MAPYSEGVDLVCFDTGAHLVGIWHVWLLWGDYLFHLGTPRGPLVLWVQWERAYILAWWPGQLGGPAPNWEGSG